MTKYHDLKNKVIVIAGGIKNLGALTAKTFALESVNLVLHYHQAKDSDTANKLKDELEDQGAKVALYQSDLSNEEEVAKLFDFAEKEFGKVDIAINT
ncbi:SDR family NAD(P)-dependent oxidoreductase, partial [Oenococcus oeni]